MQPFTPAQIRASMLLLKQLAPGASVEVRVPPYFAVSCIEGVKHTRGTPPNVVEMTPDVWQDLICGIITYEDARCSGLIDESGVATPKLAPLIEEVCKKWKENVDQ